MTQQMQSWQALLVYLLFVNADFSVQLPSVHISSPQEDSTPGRNFFLIYTAESAPAGACSSIYVNNVHQPVTFAGLTYHEFCQDQVSLPLFFQPADYKIRVVVRDAAKKMLAEASVGFTIEIPEWARHVQFHGTFDTLQTVMNSIAWEQRGGYIRFGDDIVLADGKQDQMQHVDAALQKELQDVLASSGPGVFKTLMINADLFNGVEVDMVPGNHLVDDGFALRMVEIAAQYWQPQPMTDVYSNAALSHAATSYPEFAVEFLHALRAAAPVAFVGNSNTSPVLLRHLFGPQCAFIPAPPKNAYAAIDTIMADLLRTLSAAGVPTHPSSSAAGESEDGACPAMAEVDGSSECSAASRQGSFGVVVVAFGAAGKALQLRLLPLARVFSVDFGSMLDALQGWGTRGGVHGEAAPAWIREGRFDREGFLQLFCGAAEEAALCQRELLDLDNTT